MKKILLTIALCYTFLSTTAQVLDFENFDNHPTGVMGGDISGTIFGRKYWYSFATANTYSEITDFNIYNGGNPDTGRYVHIDGFQYSTPGAKYLWKYNFPYYWGNRTLGNDVLEIETDYYSRASTSSLNELGFMILDQTQSKVLAGFKFNEFGKIYAWLYSNSTNGYGNFNYLLGDSGFSITLPKGEWVKLILRYDKNTGNATFIIKDKDGKLISQDTYKGETQGIEPAEVDYAIFQGDSMNTMSAGANFDNYKVSAVKNTLALNDVTNENDFSIYPNPATTEINLRGHSTSRISNITITDVSGRIVKQSRFDNFSNVQLNIANLSKGIYLLKVTTEKGTITKKFIKE